MRSAAVSLLGFLAAAGCLSGTPGSSRRVAAGAWGATGIALEVTDSGSRVEYDCAHGSISEPLALDSEGRFHAKGLHFREHGGPVRDDEKENGQRVLYSGEVTGDTMTLTVRPEDSDAPIGTYTLVRGKPGRLRKCL